MKEENIVFVCVVFFLNCTQEDCIELHCIAQCCDITIKPLLLALNCPVLLFQINYCNYKWWNLNRLVTFLFWNMDKCRRQQTNKVLSWFNCVANGWVNQSASVPVANKCVFIYYLTFCLLQKGLNLRPRSETGALQRLRLWAPVGTQMLSSTDSVTDPLPLGSLWKRTWGDLPPQLLPPQSLCLLHRRATREVSDTSTYSPPRLTPSNCSISCQTPSDKYTLKSSQEK